MTTDNGSTLTDILPYVSTHTLRLLNGTSLFWKEALVRNIQSDSSLLWEEGMLRLLKDCMRMHNATPGKSTQSEIRIDGDNGNNVDEGSYNSELRNILSRAHDDSESKKGQLTEDEMDSIQAKKKRERDFVEQVFEAVDTSIARFGTARDKLLPLTPNSTTAQRVYRYIITNHLRYTGPVFHMPSEIRLGEDFSLHFFEPRYCTLIAEVMEHQPMSAKRGGSIGVNPHTHLPPSFIYAYNNRLTHTPAVIVEVKYCIIYPNGRADVVLKPVAHVFVQRVWERPNSGRLFMAQVMRMGVKDSQKIERCFAQRYHGYGRHPSQYIFDEDGAIPDENEQETRHQNHRNGADTFPSVNRGVRRLISSVVARLMAGDERRVYGSSRRAAEVNNEI